MWRAVLLTAIATTSSTAEPPQAGEQPPVGDPPPLIGDDVPAQQAPAAATAGAAAPGATQAPERVRLVYAPGAFAAACPTPADVTRLVVNHLGHDPFGEPATRVMTLLLDGDGATGPVRARLELLTASLSPLGSRVVESSSGCADLVATAALQMAIALDPLTVLASSDPAEAPSSSSSSSSSPTVTPAVSPAADTAEVSPPEAVEEPPGRRRIVVVEDGVGVVVGGDAHVSNWLVSDAPMLGFALGAAVRGGMFSARTELRLDFGATSDDDQGALPTLVSVLPCAHLPILDLGDDGRFDASACGAVTAGVLPELTTAVRVGGYVGAGLRAGIDWHLDSTSVVHFFGQSEVAIWRAGIVGSPTVSTAPLNVVVGVGCDFGDWD